VPHQHSTPAVEHGDSLTTRFSRLKLNSAGRHATPLPLHLHQTSASKGSSVSLPTSHRITSAMSGPIETTDASLSGPMTSPNWPSVSIVIQRRWPRSSTNGILRSPA
jgi:hypothetical protein